MRVCSWCGNEMPSKGTDAGILTHGICAVCACALVPTRGTSLESFLDAIPHPVLQVDDDCQVLYANHNAQKSLGEVTPIDSWKKSGDVFGCVNAKNPEGCGRSIHCSACVIRDCVIKTIETGQDHYMVPAVVRAGDPDDPSAVTLAITTVKKDDAVLLTVNRFDPVQGAS